MSVDFDMIVAECSRDREGGARAARAFDDVAANGTLTCRPRPRIL